MAYTSRGKRPWPPFVFWAAAAGCLCPLTGAALAQQDAFRDGSAPPLVQSIGKLAGPIQIDADLADWPASAGTILLGQQAQTGRRFNWGGTLDASGAVRLAWDETALYLAAEVVDNAPRQASTPAEIWQGDTLELFFNAYPGQQRTDGFVQQALVVPLQEGVPFRMQGPPADFQGAQGAAHAVPGGYVVEARIPWSNIPHFTPANGAALGFQLYLDDRDGTGRKTQLMWYPSAITFSHPTHTNLLLLRDRADTATPNLLAGPNTWCVTQGDFMPVSAVCSAPGAVRVEVEEVKGTATAPGAAPALTAAFDLATRVGGVTAGQGKVALAGQAGERQFRVRALDASGRIVAQSGFKTMLVGAQFAAMRVAHQELKARLETLEAGNPQPGSKAALNLAGLRAWYGRLSAFVANEARPEALNARLLDQINGELAALKEAAAQWEAGGDPYAGRTGSFVRGYTSPLTGRSRGYALHVPADYRPNSNREWPLIVVLHSIFADERMLSLMEDSFRGVDAIVYQAASYRQLDWGGASATETWAGLDDVLAHYNVDRQRISLTGVHIGGRGAWQLAAARPDFWSAVAPLFSGIDTGPTFPALRLYPEFYATATDVRIPSARKREGPPPVTSPLERSLFGQASLAGRAGNVAHLPLQSSYGEDDPDAGAERLALQRRLEELRVPVATRYMPGAMHGSPAPEWQEPEFFAQLAAHKRPEARPRVEFTVPTLRDNTAWNISVLQQQRSSALSRITREMDARGISLTTQNVSAIRVNWPPSPSSTAPTLRIDGQELGPWTSQCVRRPDGKWVVGIPQANEKRPGLSGPMNDFQRARFLVVYGSGGDAVARAMLEKVAARVSDWGLGTTFQKKADTEVTPEDLRDAHIVVVGTPADNTLLARLATRLPLRWTGNGISLGTGRDAVEAQGPGAGACCIYPNPLAPQNYVLVVTATDEAGYQVWNLREPGGDYVVAKTGETDGKKSLLPLARGWFDNRWQFTAQELLRY